jgi:hypothetical protein
VYSGRDRRALWRSLRDSLLHYLQYFRSEDVKVHFCVQELIDDFNQDLSKQNLDSRAGTCSRSPLSADIIVAHDKGRNIFAALRESRWPGHGACSQILLEVRPQILWHRVDVADEDI